MWFSFQAFPLDMSQFVNLFNSTRVPEQGKDRLKSNPKASHMLIMKNGNFYVFDVFDRDGMCVFVWCKLYDSMLWLNILGSKWYG